ncbi:hypothetical protein QE152_g30724 [Popillia japonica]|uniref:Uncharacterized protein n=1 Tax=Popillia japonica TaxID=7064 RepID=A0AAW1JDY5_POPJA
MGFKGCIRDFHVTNRPIEKPRKVDVQRCLENIEEGNYFNGGDAVLGNRYVVGDEIDIKMDIKPRNVSGLLLSVHQVPSGSRSITVGDRSLGNFRRIVIFTTVICIPYKYKVQAKEFRPNQRASQYTTTQKNPLIQRKSILVFEKN